MNTTEDSAAPVLPATLYDGLEVDARLAVFMRVLLPKFEAAWLGLDAAAVQQASNLMTHDVDEWLDYAFDREGTTLVKFIDKCLDALRQNEVMQFLPVVNAFDFSTVSTRSAMLSLSMQIKLPLAMASVVFLSRAKMQNLHPGDRWLPSSSLSQDLMGNLRACFLFDTMLCGRAQVWGTEQDRQRELLRRSMVDSALDMRNAAAAMSESPAALHRMQQRIASLSRQLEEATSQVDMLQQQLQQRFG
jgi:hypothetical protein